MIATSFAARQLNISANSRAVDNAHRVSYDVRQALFSKRSFAALSSGFFA